MRGIAFSVLVLLVLIVLFASTYVVREWEQIVITQFGDPVGDPVTEAGLHFKLPFVQAVNRFERRILVWDGEKGQITTRDKRFIWVDTTARWRIQEPLTFLQAVRTERGAQTRLDDILDGATRDVISGHKLIEVVRLTNRVLDLPPEEEEQAETSFQATTEEARERIEQGRDRLVEAILERARGMGLEYGIELIDVRIKRINYVEAVRTTVYTRMISERQRIAERFRSIGKGLKAEIDGQRMREEKKISSEAYRKAQEIVAKADADAARIFADAYNRDPEFYGFWRTLKTYENTIGQNTTLILSPESELYRYLGSSGG
ncbi:MAG: protease modulator HflC [Planctomycetota bacterium]|jgi:membrane protease subunit HflC